MADWFTKNAPPAVAAPPPPTWSDKLVSAFGGPPSADLPFHDAVGPETRQLASSPLVHPTGIEAVDRLSSPLSLASLGVGFAKPAAGLAVKTGAAVADTVSPDVVGMLSPRLANLLRVAQRLKGAIPEAEGSLSAADRALLAKQGYSPELIEKIAAQRLAQAGTPAAPPSPGLPQPRPLPALRAPGPEMVPETGETLAQWRQRVQGMIGRSGSPAPSGGGVPANATGTSFQPAAMPTPQASAPAAPAPADAPSTLLQQLKDSLAARQSAQTANIGHNAPFGEGAILPSTMLPTELRAAEMAGLEHPGQGTWDLASGALKPKTPIDSRISSLAPGSQPLPVYPSAGTVKGVSSNALEAASNAALAAGHWDLAESLIGQSLQSFFQGSGGPMAGILAAAVAHKARQVVEPLRADPMFQRAAPAKQQQMIQQALRQPGGRASLTSLLGSSP